jgi:hypothetical protein
MIQIIIFLIIILSIRIKIIIFITQIIIFFLLILWIIIKIIIFITQIIIFRNPKIFITQIIIVFYINTLNYNKNNNIFLYEYFEL